AVGGLLVWIWPSWFAAQLIELTGLDSSVATISELLVGPLWQTWAMIAAVAIGAPVSEELLFRGYLWRLVELTSGSRGAAFVVTTLLFALYHMDPIHVVALLPTAAFLGWLRWTSGSLWPCILAHFVNNAVAVVVVQFMPRETAGALVSFAGGAAFLAVVGVGAWLSRSRSS
ncbi:MAG: CPBP family intramembrane glutamic endopeptidase, partial [Myxococcota bacterium]